LYLANTKIQLSNTQTEFKVVICSRWSCINACQDWRCKHL